MGRGEGVATLELFGCTVFSKVLTLLVPSNLAYRFHQFHASRNARKCKALLKWGCKSMQVRASLETCTEGKVFVRQVF